MTSAPSIFSDGHELLYFVETRLVGGDPRAIFTLLHEHLEFLSDLDTQGKLVFAGPLDTPSGLDRTITRVEQVATEPTNLGTPRSHRIDD
jgi:hypothetical protein